MTAQKTRTHIFLLVLLSCITFGQLDSAFAIKCSQVLPHKIEFPKDSVEVQRFIDENKANFSMLPSIDQTEIVNLRQFKTDGQMNLGTYRALIDGKEVFLKSAGRNGAKEALWLTYLNNLGLGVRFYGVTKINDNWVLVMDFVPGINIKVAWKAAGENNPDLLPKNFIVTKQMISEMKKQATLVYHAGFFDGDPQSSVKRSCRHN